MDPVGERGGQTGRPSHFPLFFFYTVPLDLRKSYIYIIILYKCALDIHTRPLIFLKIIKLLPLYKFDF